MENIKIPLKIFYDGGCKVCAWEIQKYIKLDEKQALGTIDINAPGFDATVYGLDRERVQKYFHVLTPDGRVIAGVDAFVEIWKALDTAPFRLAVKVAGNPLVHSILELGYAGFVRIRPYLPRNKEFDCADGTCSHLNRPHGPTAN